jgi:hypothetical protein
MSPAGLEGVVLAAVRASADESTGQRTARRLAGDDAAGVRSIVLSINLHSSSPWSTVAQLCCDEARAAGIVEMEGRLRPKPVVADPEALAALRPQGEQAAAARAAYREWVGELDAAVIGDCIAALLFAHHTPE